MSVSSASAERALIKVKIIKNRLRSSLLNDTLSSLLVIASEWELMRSLDDVTIINNFADSSPKLKSLLLFEY